jgi:Mg2+-importing ATPase
VDLRQASVGRPVVAAGSVCMAGCTSGPHGDSTRFGHRWPQAFDGGHTIHTIDLVAATLPASASGLPKPYWSLPETELLAQLGSGQDGLAQAEALRRLQEKGRNELEPTRRASGLVLFLNQFRSPIMLILIGATLVSAFVSDWPDAAIILAIVFGSALISFTQEYSASNAAAKLRQRVSVTATVLRDGAEQEVPVALIVPGDVVLLSAGSLVPGDARLLVGRDCDVNQAVLTGETFPVAKSPGVAAAGAALTERTNCVFMGTSVSTGTARAVVVLTGPDTAYGQIARRLDLRPPETEFERGVRRLGLLLSEVMLLMVLAVFALNVLSAKPPLDSLLFSVALAVGLTPQLLPAIINTNLARGSQQMAKVGVIVRRLSSIENFGSMDVLCTDKTGTLTEGVICLDGAVDAAGHPSPAVLRLAYLNASLQTGMANPLDAALTAQAVPDIGRVVKVDEVPYDFVRKRMSVVVEEQGSRCLICKGALEGVLKASTQVRAAAGTSELDNWEETAIHERFASWSAEGYRVLGVGSRQVDVKPAYEPDDEGGLTFEGFLLFLDPPKAGVRDTIADLEALGVTLKIVTGDNPLVARHTAEAVGLPVTGVLTGQQLQDLRDEALWHLVDTTNLFCDVAPNQKERIILALKKTGHVVGYLGDGINDAPSLHAADVGVSVDTAVDVAKEAADFVLLEHDLAVLHQGIVEGRRTFANTLKYVFMATGANFGNMFSMAGASLFLPFLPMLPKQVLLINFLTDLPEMAIAADNVDTQLVDHPRRWDIAFIRRFMFVFGPLSSVFDYATFGALIWLLRANRAHFRTAWFLESVVSAALVVLVLRTRLPVRRSRPAKALALGTLGVVLAALALPYTPLAAPLGFAALPARYVAVVTAIVAAYVLAAEAAKGWFYRREARSGR